MIPPAISIFLYSEPFVFLFFYEMSRHSKYHPGEWGYSVCRKHYENAKPESKRKAYDEICENFSPGKLHTMQH